MCRERKTDKERMLNSSSQLLREFLLDSDFTRGKSSCGGDVDAKEMSQGCPCSQGDQGDKWPSRDCRRRGLSRQDSGDASIPSEPWGHGDSASPPR